MMRTRPAPSLRTAGRVVAALACAGVMLCSATGPVAQAAPPEFQEPMLEVPETGHPGLLGLTSSVHPLEIPWLEAGDTFSWQIGLHLTEQSLADGSLEFIPYEGLIDVTTDYRLTALRCETQWTGQSGSGRELSCSSKTTTLLVDHPLRLGPTAHIPFGDVPAAGSPHILFTLSVPEKAAVAGPFTFALGFTVSGDEAARQPDLPVTGFAIAGALAAGVMLLGAGLLAKLIGRRAGRT